MFGTNSLLGFLSQWLILNKTVNMFFFKYKDLCTWLVVDTALSFMLYGGINLYSTVRLYFSLQ